MKSYQVDVVEPAAMPVLEDLERRKLIRLRSRDSSLEFKKLVEKLRSKGEPPSLEEITAEVEAVRSSRFARRNES